MLADAVASDGEMVADTWTAAYHTTQPLTLPPEAEEAAGGLLDVLRQ